jgi:hypothetical protein
MLGPQPVTARRRYDLERMTRRLRGARSMKRIIVLAALAIAPACSSKAAAISNDDLEVTEVPCVVARGAPLYETGDPMPVGLSGPGACKRAIEVFLDAHAADRIVSVIAVAHDAEPDVDMRASTAGTQRLIVLHTAHDGPWPRGRELGVGHIACLVVADPDSGSADTRDGGRSCGTALREYTSFPPIAMWVPITHDGETDAVLVLYRGEPHRRP